MIKKKQALFVLIISLAFAFIGCSESDDSGVTPEDHGYNADIGDIQNYLNWNRVDYTIYPVNTNLLGAAHEANNPDVARAIFANRDLTTTNGEYPRETIVVKETFGWDGNHQTFGAMGKLGMVKRGGDFNPDNGGWEWIVLSEDGTSIMDRGADLGDGMCNACHTNAAGANGEDFVFNHPSEYEIADADIWGFFDGAPSNWDQIDSNIGPDPFLGMAHGVTDTTLTRDVYRWQPGGKYLDGEFPVGTALMKEVRDDQGNYANGGEAAWTAMVKRTSGNGDGTDWDWFMMNPVTQEVMRLPRDPADNMCISCHTSANSGGNGGDFVFNHPDLGF